MEVCAMSTKGMRTVQKQRSLTILNHNDTQVLIKLRVRRAIDDHWTKEPIEILCWVVRVVPASSMDISSKMISSVELTRARPFSKDIPTWRLNRAQWDIDWYSERHPSKVFPSVGDRASGCLFHLQVLWCYCWRWLENCQRQIPYSKILSTLNPVSPICLYQWTRILVVNEHGLFQEAISRWGSTTDGEIIISSYTSLWWILRVIALAVLVPPGETIQKRLIFGSARELVWHVEKVTLFSKNLGNGFCCRVPKIEDLVWLVLLQPEFLNGVTNPDVPDSAAHCAARESVAVTTKEGVQRNIMIMYLANEWLYIK